jgi:hypothetical protein
MPKRDAALLPEDIRIGAGADRALHPLYEAGRIPGGRKDD